MAQLHFESPIWIEIEDLATLGWIVITWVGEENMYFTDADGTEYFCKID